MSMESSFRALKIVQKALEAKVTGRRFPIMVYFLVTTRCNLKCFYCYPETQAGRDPARNRRDMSLEEIKRTIDDLVRLGMRWVCLMGGEPLVRKDIGPVIEHVRSKRIICEMISNGYFVPDYITDLRKLDSLVISIDGDEQSNDLNRGQGCYEHALNGLDTALAHGIRCRIHAILTKHNKDSIEHVAALARERSIPVTFSMTSGGPTSSVERGTSAPVAGGPRSLPIFNDPSAYLSDTEIKSCWKRIRELKLAGYPVQDSAKFLGAMVDFPVRYGEVIRRDDPRIKTLPWLCKMGRLSCNVDADGSIYPCAALFKKVGLNSREVGTAAAWRHLAAVDCVQCGEISGGGDLSVLLSLDPGGVWHAAKYLVSGLVSAKRGRIPTSL